MGMGLSAGMSLLAFVLDELVFVSRQKGVLHVRGDEGGRLWIFFSYRCSVGVLRRSFFLGKQRARS